MTAVGRRSLFRGHAVRAIVAEPAGLVLWVKRNRGDAMARLSVREASALRDRAEGPLRDELDEALRACLEWEGTHSVAR